MFDTYEEMELHWTTECLIARSACNLCNAEIARNARANHNCMEQLVFNRDEHYEYIGGHEKQIEKAHLGNERLIKVTMGREDEVEKEPMQCMMGHNFEMNKGPRYNTFGVNKETRYCLVCKRGWHFRDVDCHVICSQPKKCDRADLCPECSLCPQGHVLEIRYKRPWIYENVQCNRCYMD